MEGLENCFVIWVKHIQFNKNELGKEISSLSELSDGVLLYSLMNTV